MLVVWQEEDTRSHAGIKKLSNIMMAMEPDSELDDKVPILLGPDDQSVSSSDHSSSDNSDVGVEEGWESNNSTIGGSIKPVSVEVYKFGSSWYARI